MPDPKSYLLFSRLLQPYLSYSRRVSACCVVEAAPILFTDAVLKIILRFNSEQSCSVCDFGSLDDPEFI